MPKIGVYAVKAKVDGTMYDGMCNIGYRPTVSSEGERRIELHIFNFNEQIYQKNVELYFIDRIRDEKQFDSVENLKAQLQNDEVRCKDILRDFTLLLGK